jgi:hypothetical protein
MPSSYVSYLALYDRPKFALSGCPEQEFLVHSKTPLLPFSSIHQAPPMKSHVSMNNTL